MWEEENNKLILASASPRRKAILELMGLKFAIIKPKGLQENSKGNPYQAVEANSEAKAVWAAEHIKSGTGLFCGFDTIVYFNNKVWGKPSSRREAFELLTQMSGRRHEVVTGVCILDKASGHRLTGHEITAVEFRELEEPEIGSYLKSGQVLDKAGAYNIGGRGALLVKRIEGCFYNVMGLPVARFIEMLKDMNYKILGER
ncbi:MAG: Maf family protein [Actinomycetota bacterium]|nr:Maf family protein [Actinomycetota bacterium]